MRGVVALVSVVVLATIPTPTPAHHTSTLPAPDGLVALRGDLHSHTGYSDGRGTPAEAFAAVKAMGTLDFFVVSEHSEWFLFPFEADGTCVIPGDDRFGDLTCLDPQSPLPGDIEWNEVATAAAAGSDDDFLAMRAFEWSSPIEGHINVFFTDLWVDFLMTGAAPMHGFYAWLVHAAGDEAVATFNHPGREELMFDDLAYVPEVDPKMAALEVFNRGRDFTDQYRQALDQGWHVGAIGVTDGHTVDKWTHTTDGRSVVLAESNTPAAIRDALLAHRTVAIRGYMHDARLTVNGEPMGSTIAIDNTADALFVQVDLLDTAGGFFTKLEILGPAGYRVVTSVGFGVPVSKTVAIVPADIPLTDAGERYVFARAFQGDRVVAVTSPVWIAEA